jgi:nucleotide-binding universal stress UspA family protein
VRTALELHRGAGATLHVAHVAPQSAVLLAAGGRRAEYEKELKEALARLGARDGEFELHVQNGDTASALGRIAEGVSADVIVIGKRSPSAPLMAGHPLGGTAYSVITASARPTLVVTRPLPIPLRTAVVAIDNSQTTRGALHVALSWASALRNRDAEWQPTLTALHVDQGSADPTEKRHERELRHELDVLQRNATGWAGVRIDVERRESPDVVDAIAKYAAQSSADLVILGTRARADAEQRLGSVAAALTSQLDTAVLLVPPAVWRNHAADIDYW